MMKPWLIVFSQVWPWPRDAGNRERIHQLVQYLRRDFRVCFVAIPRRGSSPMEGREFCDATVFDFFPQFLHERLLSELLRLARRIAFRRLHPLNDAGVSDHDPVLQWLLGTAIRKIRPAAVICEYLWTVRSACLECSPLGIPVYLDVHDIISLRAQRERELGLVPSKPLTVDEETKYWRMADVILSIQPEETHQIQRMLPGREVLTVPHSPGELEARNEEETSGNVLCVASGAAPNLDGLEGFLSTQWDGVRQAVPGATLTIVGSVCDCLQSTPSKKNGVVLKGVTPDLRTYYRRAAVVLNPVRYGSGLKIKSVEALFHGKCLLTTPAGGEGLPGEDGFVVAAFDLLGPALVRLLCGPRERLGTARRGREIYRNHFSPEACYGELVRHLLAITQRPKP